MLSATGPRRAKPVARMLAGAVSRARAAVSRDDHTAAAVELERGAEVSAAALRRRSGTGREHWQRFAGQFVALVDRVAPPPPADHGAPSSSSTTGRHSDDTAVEGERLLARGRKQQKASKAVGDLVSSFPQRIVSRLVSMGSPSSSSSTSTITTNDGATKNSNNGRNNVATSSSSPPSTADAASSSPSDIMDAVSRSTAKTRCVSPAASHHQRRGGASSSSSSSSAAARRRNRGRAPSVAAAAGRRASHHRRPSRRPVPAWEQAVGLYHALSEAGLATSRATVRQLFATVPDWVSAIGDHYASKQEDQPPSSAHDEDGNAATGRRGRSGNASGGGGYTTTRWVVAEEALGTSPWAGRSGIAGSSSDETLSTHSDKLQQRIDAESHRWQDALRLLCGAAGAWPWPQPILARRAVPPGAHDEVPEDALDRSSRLDRQAHAVALTALARAARLAGASGDWAAAMRSLASARVYTESMGLPTADEALIDFTREQELRLSACVLVALSVGFCGGTVTRELAQRTVGALPWLSRDEVEKFTELPPGVRAAAEAVLCARWALEPAVRGHGTAAAGKIPPPSLPSSSSADSASSPLQGDDALRRPAAVVSAPGGRELPIKESNEMRALRFAVLASTTQQQQQQQQPVDLRRKGVIDGGDEGDDRAHMLTAAVRAMASSAAASSSSSSPATPQLTTSSGDGGGHTQPEGGATAVDVRQVRDQSMHLAASRAARRGVLRALVADAAANPALALSTAQATLTKPSVVGDGGESDGSVVVATTSTSTAVPPSSLPPEERALTLAAVLRARRAAVATSRRLRQGGATTASAAVDTEALAQVDEASRATSIACLGFTASAISSMRSSRGDLCTAVPPGELQRVRTSLSQLAVRSLLEIDAATLSASLAEDRAKSLRLLAVVLAPVRLDGIAPRDRLHLRRRLARVGVEPSELLRTMMSVVNDGGADAWHVRRVLLPSRRGRRRSAPGQEEPSSAAAAVDNTTSTATTASRTTKSSTVLARIAESVASGDWEAAVTVAALSNDRDDAQGLSGDVRVRIAVNRVLCRHGHWALALAFVRRRLSEDAAMPTSKEESSGSSTLQPPSPSSSSSSRLWLLEAEPVITALRAAAGNWQDAVALMASPTMSLTSSPSDHGNGDEKGLRSGVDQRLGFEDPAKLLTFASWQLWQPAVRSASSAWHAAMAVATAALQQQQKGQQQQQQRATNANRLIYLLRLQAKHFRWQQALAVAASWDVVEQHQHPVAATTSATAAATDRTSTDFGSRTIHVCLTSGRWAEATRLLTAMAGAGVPITGDTRQAVTVLSQRRWMRPDNREALLHAAGMCGDAATTAATPSSGNRGARRQHHTSSSGRHGQRLSDER